MPRPGPLSPEKKPEADIDRALQSHAPRNIRAGHIRHLDDVVEHFRQQHIKDEERKAKKLAEQQR